ncbi:unnamed protein product [Acanthosepion pharaonis]|uniref:Uncharacterized protein n=1 Tax=Acanthosepion pharaonis TaxID=158019 RepID=A0A812EAY6_ACAPH|nr:unnamed protein product [Sepia pharaonis]
MCIASKNFLPPRMTFPSFPSTSMIITAFFRGIKSMSSSNNTVDFFLSLYISPSYASEGFPRLMIQECPRLFVPAFRFTFFLPFFFYSRHFTIFFQFLFSSIDFPFIYLFFIILPFLFYLFFIFCSIDFYFLLLFSFRLFFLSLFISFFFFLFFLFFFLHVL